MEHPQKKLNLASQLSLHSAYGVHQYHSSIIKVSVDIRKSVRALSAICAALMCCLLSLCHMLLLNTTIFFISIVGRYPRQEPNNVFFQCMVSQTMWTLGGVTEIAFPLCPYLESSQVADKTSAVSPEHAGGKEGRYQGESSLSYHVLAHQSSPEVHHQVLRCICNPIDHESAEHLSGMSEFVWNFKRPTQPSQCSRTQSTF